MSGPWPKMLLGEVLKHRKEFIEIDDLAVYKRPRVQLHAKGIVLRDVVPGALIKTKRQQVCRAGELLVAEIDAKVGGFGIVPPALDGSLVSSHYFLFEVDESRLVRGFLDYFTRTRAFRNQVEAQGSTNYAAIRPADVLGYELPLPPLAEQRRAVARIEELTAWIRKADGIRRDSAVQGESLLSSQIALVLGRVADRYGTRTLKSFDPLVTSGPRNWGRRYEDGGYRFYRAQDIGSEGRLSNDSKVFVAPPPGLQGRSAMLQPGDLMLVITGATVGRGCAFDESLERGFVSQHVAICRLPPAQIDPYFALWSLRGPEGQAQLLNQRYGQGKPGLSLSNIRALRVPLPPLAEQRSIVRDLDTLEDQVADLRRLQLETSTELDAMLRSTLDRAFDGEL